MTDKEGIDVAKQQIACACLFACAAHMIENPANFQAAEVSAERQPGFCAKTILSSLASKLGDIVGSACILPDNGVRNRFAAFAVPNDGSLTLVSDSDGSEIESG